MSPCRRWIHALLLLPMIGWGGACGGAEGPEAGAAPRSGRTFARMRDPELAEVRRAIEVGHAELAMTLLERIQGFEAECLRARAERLRDDGVAALAALERARALDPGHPELLGTEVEILVALELLPAAAEHLAEAFKKVGPDPALLRAQGVYQLRRQGHGPSALQALERARALDPELPFLAWPLAQAHLLVGRARLEEAPAEATVHGLAAQEQWPDLEDALELQAEGLSGELRFEEAIALYEALEERGRNTASTRSTLHQRCATRCLLENDRAAAIEHYLAARGLGLDDEGLGFGAEVLREEQGLCLERGIAAADAQDWKGAEGWFVRALELRPGDLESLNHLGVACFQQENYRAAAEAWARLLGVVGPSGLGLPDPVPLNLAKAWRLAGESERARNVLDQLLDDEPDGPWAESARELLVVLEAEELVGR